MDDAWTVEVQNHDAKGLVHTIYDYSNKWGSPEKYATYFIAHDEAGRLIRITMPSKEPDFDIQVWPKTKNWRLPSTRANPQPASRGF